MFGQELNIKKNMDSNIVLHSTLALVICDQPR